MVNRVHSHAAYRWTPPMPARSPSLTVRDVLMVEISDLADGRHAIQTELANFAGRQLHERNVAFLTEQLRRAACGTHDLRALARLRLQVVQLRSGWDEPDRHGVSRQNVRAFARRHRHP